MVVKDDNDVPINIGDLCMVNLSSTLIKGRVIDIKEGGMLVGRQVKTPMGPGQQMTPGKVTLMVELELQFHPQQPVVNGLLALRDPTPEKATAIKKSYEAKGGKKSGLLELPN